MIRHRDGSRFYMPNDWGWSRFQHFRRDAGRGVIFLGYSPLLWSTLYAAVSSMPNVLSHGARLFFAAPGEPWQQVARTI